MSQVLLKQIHSWQEEGACVYDVRLFAFDRDVYLLGTSTTTGVALCMDRRIFPVSYPCWHVYLFISIYACTLTCYTENMESEVEMLRSILAQLEYTYEVCFWHSQGVLLRHNLYILRCTRLRDRCSLSKKMKAMFSRYTHVHLLIV